MQTAPPEIIAEKTWIHAAEGYDIQLVCILHGDINSEVRQQMFNKFHNFKSAKFPLQMMWYLNSFLLDPTERRSMITKGDKYILNISNFQQSDFGNYR